jgi:predicted RNA-binding Zn ribbon-like protein
MAVNEEFRSKRSKEFSSLNSRIHDLRSVILPTDVSVEKLREEDLEDFQLEMEEMLEAVVEDKSQPANDVRVKTWLQQLEDKVNTSATITEEELSKLQGHFASSHGDVMHLLEAKLGAMDIQTDIGTLLGKVTLPHQPSLP